MSSQISASKNVAIIGSGFSGAAAAKEALVCGLTPKVFEKGPAIGGLWNPTTGAVWNSLRTNISFISCMFSDFAWKTPSTPFPNPKEMFGYLSAYIEHFDILKYIQFNSPVQTIKRVQDKWEVTWLNNQNKQSHSETFNYVVVCSGIFSRAATPTVKEIEKMGAVTHSHAYKNNESFKDRTVTVIGNSYSGCEIAVDIALVARKVIHVIHKAVWIVPRYISQKPIDLVLFTRKAAARHKGMPPEESHQIKNQWLRTLCANQEDVDPLLTVKTPPTHPPFSNISDEYVGLVKQKKIIVKEESSPALESDAAIVCNGFQAELPFFEQDILKAIGYVSNDQLQPLLLHKTVFHPAIPGIGFVGVYRGPFIGIIELQARWVTMVFSGRLAPPSPEVMEKGIAEEKRIRELNPRPQFPHGSYVEFADDLANEIGVLPNFKKMKDENPSLHKLLWEGPLLLPSYRLTGFGSNPDMAISLIKQIEESHLKIPYEPRTI